MKIPSGDFIDALMHAIINLYFFCSAPHDDNFYIDGLLDLYWIVEDPVSEIQTDDSIDLEKHDIELFDQIVENMNEASGPNRFNHEAMKQVAEFIRESNRELFDLPVQTYYVVNKLHEYYLYRQSNANAPCEKSDF